MQDNSLTNLGSNTHWLRSVSMTARRWQATIFAIKVFQMLAQVATYWHFSLLIHQIVIKQQEVHPQQSIGFIASMLGWGLLIYMSDFLRSQAKKSLESDIEHDVYKHLYHKQLKITRQHSPTYFQQLLMVNLSDIGDYLTQYTVQKWLTVCGPIIVFAVILPIHYLIALALLVMIPTVPIFMVLVGKGAAALHRKHFVALERLGDMFSDRLKALTLITTTGTHQSQQDRLQNASNIVNRKTMKVVSIAFLSTTVLDFFSTISIALVAVFIGFNLLGEIKLGPEIELYQGLFMLLVAPLLFSELKHLGRLYHQKAKAVAGSERFESIFKDKIVEQQTSKFEQIAWLNFRLETPQIFANSLVLKKGDWVRLEGVSGSGKTTFMEALIGFRNSTHVLSGTVGLLSQQVAFLDDTLAFNLHLGHNDINSEAQIQSLNSVGLSSWFLNLSNGLDTRLGDCPKLSGGEAQRLALARVLLQDKDIILLDEPTAHLTLEQHLEIAELIQQKLRHKTVIWASHKILPEHWFNQTWQIENSEIRVIK